MQTAIRSRFGGAVHRTARSGCTACSPTPNQVRLHGVQLHRRAFLQALGATTLLSALPARAQQQKPNIVLIVADDIGRGDLGCLGNPVAKTPHFDQFAGESLCLANFHVDPTGAPTRAGLLTGRYSARMGVWNGTAAVRRLPGDEATLATAFAEEGYATGYVGVWPLGMQPPSRPQDHGFQSVFTRADVALNALALPWDTDGVDDAYLRDGVSETCPGPATEVWFREAAAFIDAHRAAPHFLMLSLAAPWEGTAPTQEELASFPADAVPAEIAVHYARVARFDAALGQLRAQMAALGTDKSTLLVYLSGNGTSDGVQLYAPEGVRPEDGVPQAGFNDGMRGKKGSAYDGGHRVPCFLRFPETIPGKPVDLSALVAHIDLVPTLLELCGIRKPRAVKPDGVDLSKLFLGDTDRAPERWVYVVNQSGAKEQKFDAFAALSDRWRMVGTELFDMAADGSDIQCLSFHETNEWHPSVTHDGRIIYTRWDYVDRFGCTAHMPWITTLDGRDSRAVHGNFAPRPSRPDMELSVRAVPGSQKFVATAAPHHGQAFGSLVLIVLGVVVRIGSSRPA